MFSARAAQDLPPAPRHRRRLPRASAEHRCVETLRVAETRELVGWILSFGGGVRVVRPDALRDEIRRAARQILRGK
ncbi:MAG: WYL domain-containing protein [Candidatus Rokuibacteriota bacterium]